MTMAIGLQPRSTLRFIIWTLIATEIHCTRPPDRCPQLCRCEFEDQPFSSRVVTCSDTEFTILPLKELTGLPSIRILVLSGNNFTFLNESSFDGMTDLEELILHGNGIRSVAPTTFQSLSGMWKLDLSHNELNTPPLPISFDKPYHVRVLNLSHNQISRLNNGSFMASPELEQLELFGNEINYVSINAFQGLDKLQSLNLGSNRINQLNWDTFGQSLSQLLELNLENNHISDVAPNTFAKLINLQRLSLSRNTLSYVSPATFEGLQQLTHLHLSSNRIRYLSDRWITHLPKLEYLDLSANLLSKLQPHQLSPAPKLTEIDLNRMPELVEVKSDALSELPSLRRISFVGSARLKYLNPYVFGNSSAVESLDLSDCALQTLHRNLVRFAMPNLKYLALRNNDWRCDCSLKWLSDFMTERPDIFQLETQDIMCANPANLRGRSLGDVDMYQNANCSNASVINYIPNASFRLGSTALLECQVEGNPKPEVSWYTPESNVLHWYSLSSDMETYPSAHPSFHDSQGVAIAGKRLFVLKNGNLFISQVETEDAGVYVCVAGNSLGNHSVYMSLTLDFGVLQHVKIVSILVGLAGSVAFMLLMLVVQLVQMILNRWGWCCCRAALPPKAKRIRKMLESVEHYKSQQLERLRDNYNMQVQRIKDNCTQQMEKLRDSYSSQTERLRDFRDYGTHQIDRIRDQYYEQVRRVRDYSAQQMSRVRENYVVQRNRIRKFSAHQLFKLRENYKVQQLHLNKILENLNLESCRTVCARTDSVMFNSEIISMGPGFPPDMDLPQPIPLPSSVSSSGSVDIELQKFEMQTLSHLSNLPETSTNHINFDLDDDDDSVSFQDAMDGTEFQLVQGLQDTFIVDPHDPDLQRSLRTSNDIIV